MIILSTYFGGKDGNPWDQLICRWVGQAQRHTSAKLMVATDEAITLPAGIKNVGILRVSPSVYRRPEGERGDKNKQLQDLFMRKTDILLRGRELIKGEGVLYLDLDAWIQRDPVPELHRMGLLPNSCNKVAMAFDAAQTIATPKTFEDETENVWPATPWHCGGIIYIGGAIGPVWLQRLFMDSVNRCQWGGAAGHYLLEQIAWSAIMGHLGLKGKSQTLNKGWNCVPHLGHMRVDDPVIHHHHGPAKWRELKR